MEIEKQLDQYRAHSDGQLYEALKQVLFGNGRDSGSRVIDLNVIIMAFEARGLSVDPKIKDMAKKGIDSMVASARLDAESRGVRIFDLGMPENLRLRFQCQKCGEPWSPEGNQDLPTGFKCPKCTRSL